MQTPKILIVGLTLFGAIALFLQPSAGICADSMQAYDLEADDDVLAVVNGYRITRKFVTVYREQLQNTAAGAVHSRSDKQLLGSLVDEILLAQEARSLGIDTTFNVKEAIETATNSILARALLRTTETRNVISEHRLEQEYADRMEEIWPTRYHLRQIVLKEQSEAAEIIDELMADGDFEQLARSRSANQSSRAGGTLGWITLGMLPETLRETVSQLERGKYNRVPIESEQGWHVMRLEGIQEPHRPKLEEVRAVFTRYLQKESLRKYLEALRARAEIQFPNK